MSIIDPDEFALRYSELSDDEQAVLSEMLRRLEMGAEQYGRLDLDSDSRDFRKEAREEALDYFVYSIADSIKQEREGSAGRVRRDLERAKDWNACPYASHADDCDCGGMGGDR